MIGQAVAGVAVLAPLVLAWWLGRWLDRLPPRHRGSCGGSWLMVLEGFNRKGLEWSLWCPRCGATAVATREKVEAAVTENRITGLLAEVRVTGGEDGKR